MAKPGSLTPRAKPVIIAMLAVGVETEPALVECAGQKQGFWFCTVFHPIAPPGTFRDSVDFHHGTEPKAFFIGDNHEREDLLQPNRC